MAPKSKGVSGEPTYAQARSPPLPFPQIADRFYAPIKLSAPNGRRYLALRSFAGRGSSSEVGRKSGKTAVHIRAAKPCTCAKHRRVLSHPGGHWAWDGEEGRERTLYLSGENVGERRMKRNASGFTTGFCHKPS